ncbi:MAG: Xaa-Pro aminopeptidase [Alphaproteobacteria bacterium]|jgi:Xaa-Pro aminopeptidase
MVETALRAVMNRPGKPPALSLAERDRRHALIRGSLRERGIDALIVAGTDLLYLSGGVSGEEFGFLPTDENEPFEVIVAWRWLSDIPAETLLGSQEWVTKIRSGRDASPLIGCIEELHLQEGTIGIAGPFTYRDQTRLMSALPSANFADVSDILNDARTIKSTEEITLIDRANHVFDAAVQRVHEKARPGMLGSEIVQMGYQAMWDAGGDMGSAIGFNFGKEPAQNPVLAEICHNLPIQQGDIGTLTGYAKYYHYAGHSDQEIVFGDPKPHHLRMFESVKAVRAQVLSEVRAGTTQRAVIDAYQTACQDSGYLSSAHSQIHQYGMNVPEFPGPSFKLADAKGGRGLAGGGNFTLSTGMIYSISPTLVDEATGDSLLGGTSLAITDDGYRELGNRDVEILVAG